MLNDARDGLLVFRFTYDGWYRNENEVLYRWEDFKQVEFKERGILVGLAFPTGDHHDTGLIVAVQVFVYEDLGGGILQLRPNYITPCPGDK